APGLEAGIAQLANEGGDVDLRRDRSERQAAAPRVQLDGAGLIQAHGDGQAAGQQRLIWQRRGYRFFVSDAVLKTAEDRPWAQHQLQLLDRVEGVVALDRKSTRLNSSHVSISYAV